MGLIMGLIMGLMRSYSVFEGIRGGYRFA
jgi:hypothetical protein